MFKDLKIKVQERFKELTSSNKPLFYIDIDREEIWNQYLNGFVDTAEQQSHNCNCCKSFLRQYSGIVSIVDNKIQTIWDIQVDELYSQPIKNIRDYIVSRPITDMFVNSFTKLGTDKNIDKTSNVVWEHFYLELPRTYVNANALSLDTIRGEKRDNKTVLKRSLDELKIDSTETILELIAQNSLYRGKEFEGILRSFLKIQKEYQQVPVQLRDNYCWQASQSVGQALCRIRNTSIGTLLIDLSNGIDLDSAVTSFERVVAPTNYKRPTSLVTPKMVEEAKAKLVELGYLESLNRRFAVESDLNINNLLFVDKSSNLDDVFEAIKKDVQVNSRSLNKVEEISINDFIEKVLPQAKGIKLLLENNHLNNMVSLLTADSGPSFFKWNNPFSWAYTGGITDSMKERVAKLGGRVDGVFRFTHSWNEIEPNQSLMDLHVFMPGNSHSYAGNCHNNYGSGRRVGWNQRKDTLSGGVQDVDYVNQAPAGYIPIENITFPDLSRMPEGKYICKIHNWNFRGTGGRGQAEIEFEGNIYQYEYPKTKHKEWVTIAEVTLKDGKFSIEHKLSQNSSTNEKWNLKTQRFHKVKQILLSPNHWEGESGIGNRHWFFILENCASDEATRPFFNEFLKEELTANRKFFEVLGNKLSVSPTTSHLAGIGFSDTKRDSIYVEVQGTFNRTLKINF